MIENKNWYNYVTDPWKGIFILTPEKSFMQCQKWKYLVVIKLNAADRRSPRTIFKVFFSAVIYFGANTSPVERVLNIKGT